MDKPQFIYISPQLLHLKKFGGVFFAEFWVRWVFIAARLMAFSSFCEWGAAFSLVAVHRLLVLRWLLSRQSTGSWRAGFNSCDTQA